VAQLHHKLIYDVNKRKYRIAEPLVQAQPGVPGDFIYHYDIRLAFETEGQKESFQNNFPSPTLPPEMEVSLGKSRHVYAPLYQDKNHQGVKDLKLKTLAISPDSLNLGERKFVDDLQGFLAEPNWKAKLIGYQFYLMRNVESLRSVGVYLDTETRAYFPDFVLWAVGSNKTHILLIDPKGQSGIMDWNSLSSGANAKVALANSSDLKDLGRQLGSRISHPCDVSSFILLRKSSPLGKANGENYNLPLVSEMVNKHVLHLNWAPEINGSRVDEDGDRLPNPPEDRCYLERIFALARII
jgi:hypothetical protein